MATTRTQLTTIANKLLHGASIQSLTGSMANADTSPAWRKAFDKIINCRVNGVAGNTIFTKGNSKLPFLSFSALPGEGFCPGAGDCLNHCYSFKAFRYPMAYARMAQNSLLLQTTAGRELIIADLDKKTHDKKGNPKPTTVRLYVDGDHMTADIFRFWMGVIADRPHLTVYGYSKSFQIIKDNADIVPSNYVLNLSSGSNSPQAFVDSLQTLPFVRGNFIATDTGNKSDYLAATGKRAFECPGLCGSCLPSGAHACGDIRISKDIIIAVH
jgi:hypothetical protein